MELKGEKYVGRIEAGNIQEGEMQGRKTCKIQKNRGRKFIGQHRKRKHEIKKKEYCTRRGWKQKMSYMEGRTRRER